MFNGVIGVAFGCVRGFDAPGYRKEKICQERLVYLPYRGQWYGEKGYRTLRRKKEGKRGEKLGLLTSQVDIRMLLLHADEL